MTSVLRNMVVSKEPPGNGLSFETKLDNADVSNGAPAVVRVSESLFVRYFVYESNSDKCLKWFLTPFYWMWRSFDIYFLGCSAFYCSRCATCVEKLVCCVPCGVECYFFEDKSFPPNAKSLGFYDGSDGKTENYEWKRAKEFFPDHVPSCKNPVLNFLNHDPPGSLFHGKIEPSDIAQGKLGNCWLMTALACMSEYPGAIHNLFVTREYAESGRYTVRLYNGLKKEWQLITVDDYFPTENGKPIFAQPNDREMWCMVFEKAFAKYLGGYDMLAGGNIILALQALTGDPVFHLSKNEDNTAMEKFDLKYFDKGNEGEKDSLGRQKLSIGLSRGDKKVSFTRDEVFKLLKKFAKSKAVMGAGTGGTDEGTSTAQHGLVQGHAYSILDVREMSNGKFSGSSKFRLVKLRNPWGKFEWTGAWSDDSSEWNKFGNVARKLKQDKGRDSNDGTFWMPFDEFWENFQQIDICDRTTGFRDLALSIHEDQGLFAPIQGCAWGCFKFWFMCKGCRASVFGHQAAETQPELNTYLAHESTI